MIGGRRVEQLLLRWPVLAVACLSASFLTYILPEIVSIVLHPPTLGFHNLAFPAAMSVIGGLYIWLLLVAALAWMAKGPDVGPQRGVLAGVLAGVGYLVVALAFSLVTPASDISLAEVVVRILLTPFVQARMLALHRAIGWGLSDPPLGWSFVLSPLVGCTFGGWLYGALSSRRPTTAGHSP